MYRVQRDSCVFFFISLLLISGLSPTLAGQETSTTNIFAEKVSVKKIIDGYGFTLLTDDNTIIGISFDIWSLERYWIFSNKSGEWRTRQVTNPQGRLPEWGVLGLVHNGLINYVNIISGNTMVFLIGYVNKDPALVTMVFVSAKLDVYEITYRLPSPFIADDILDVIFESSTAWFFLKKYGDPILIKLNFDYQSEEILYSNSIPLPKNSTSFDKNHGRVFLFARDNQIGIIAGNALVFVDKDKEAVTHYKNPLITQGRPLGEYEWIRMFPLWMEEGFPVVIWNNATYFEVRKYPYVEIMHSYVLPQGYEFPFDIASKPVSHNRTATFLMGKYIQTSIAQLSVLILTITANESIFTPLTQPIAAAYMPFNTWQYYPETNIYYGTYNSFQVETYIVSNKNLTGIQLLSFKNKWSTYGLILVAGGGTVVTVAGAILVRKHSNRLRKFKANIFKHEFEGHPGSKYDDLRNALERGKE